jgi:curved DNA-binding protein
MRAKGHGLKKAGERGYLFVQLKAVMPKNRTTRSSPVAGTGEKAAFDPRENF